MGSMAHATCEHPAKLVPRAGIEPARRFRGTGF